MKKKNKCIHQRWFGNIVNFVKRFVKGIYHIIVQGLKGLHTLVVYVFKYVLGILALVGIGLVLFNIALATDDTECAYKSELLTMSGSCSKMFFIFNQNPDMLKLVGADYDYNTFDKVLHWESQIINDAKKMDLSKQETSDFLEKFYDRFVDELKEAHNLIFNGG